MKQRTITKGIFIVLAILVIAFLYNNLDLSNAGRGVYYGKAVSVSYPHFMSELCEVRANSGDTASTLWVFATDNVDLCRHLKRNLGKNMLFNYRGFYMDHKPENIYVLLSVEGT